MAIYYIAYELHEGELDDYCSMDEVLQKLGAKKIMPFMWFVQLPGSQVKIFEMIKKYLPDPEHDKLLVIKPREVCKTKTLSFIPGTKALAVETPVT